MENNCNFCAIKSELKCSKCAKVYYCGGEHQKLDWKIHRKVCFPFQIENNPEKGRLLVATKNLKPFDIIVKEEPLVNLPSASDDKGRVSNCCISCLKYVDAEDVKSCTKCRWPICSMQCQNDPIHAVEECQLLSTRKIRPDILGAELVLQIIRCLLLKKSNPDKYQALLKLKASLEEKKSSIHFLAQYLTVEKILIDAFGSDVNESEVITILGILNTNTLSEQTDIRSKGNRRVSCHLFATACFANHSCTPNARPIIFQDGKLHLVATTDISAGEEITITYQPLIEGNLARQRKHARYHFSCKCPRCLDPFELGTYFSAVKCISCKNGFASPKYEDESLDDEKVVWICDNENCPQIFDNPGIRRMLQFLQNRVDSITGSSSYNKQTIAEYERVQKECLALLHPNHYIMFDLEYDFLEFLHNYFSECLKVFDRSRIVVVPKVSKLAEKLLKILDVISPGPRLIRGRVLFFYTTGLCDDKVTDALAKGYMEHEGGKSKAKGKKRAEAEAVTKYKKVVGEAMEILKLEPPEADDAFFVAELARQLNYLE